MGAAEAYTQRFEGIVKDKAATISCKSRSTYQAVDAATQKHSQHFEELVNNKATMVTTKAKSASQAATVVRAKTGEGLHMARGKVLSAIGNRVQSAKQMVRGGA